MKNLIFSFVVIGILLCSCCKNKEPKITETITLSQEMKDYFVNYNVGTKWIYQDTIDKNNYDTIELVSIKESNQNIRGTLYKGFILDYLPMKSKNFQIRIDPGINKSYYVKVDPMVTAAGAISFEFSDNKWAHWVSYYDSITVYGTRYFNVIKSKHNNQYQYDLTISKLNGIVFFLYSNVNPQKPFGAAYKLINILKP